MDISVSRLNNRMALQVPAELPLGLVFITGWVEKLFPSGSAKLKQVEFELVEGQHRLVCRVPQQVIDETHLEAGARIRVSGHLVFEPRSVHYYLLARDLEVLAAVPQPAQAKAPPITLGTVRQRAEAASLKPGELPPWVEKLAPREIQEELGLLPKQEEADEVSTVGSPQPLAAGKESPLELTPEMLDFLSGAIDSDEDIELTREMIRDYLPQKEDESGQQEDEPIVPAVTESVTPPTVGEKIYQESTPVHPPQKQVMPQRSALTRAPLSSGEVPRPDGRIAKYWQLWVLVFVLLLMLFLMLLLGLTLWNIFFPGEIGLLIMTGV